MVLFSVLGILEDQMGELIYENEKITRIKHLAGFLLVMASGE